MKMGLEPVLVEMLALQLIATSFFNHFEGETPALKKILKWVVLDGLTIGLYYWLQYWAMLFPLILLVPGMYVHFRWCRKHGIHPVKATPLKKYYELRGWEWRA
jgi:hypothetical protein